MEKKKVHLAELLPVMKETLEAGGTVKLPITGTSMLPLLVQGRDFVFLKKPQGRCRKFDIPFYRRRDGAFVLHRIVDVQKETYTLCGDNQWVLEEGIRDDQIIGVVTAIERDGKQFSTEDKKYQSYVKRWHHLLPIRKYLVRVRGVLHRLEKEL